MGKIKYNFTSINGEKSNGIIDMPTDSAHISVYALLNKIKQNEANSKKLTAR